MKLGQFLKILCITTVLTIGSTEIVDRPILALEKEQNISVERVENDSENTEDLNAFKIDSKINPQNESLDIENWLKLIGFLVFTGLVAKYFRPLMVRIDRERVGIVYKKFGSSLPSNRQIALNREMGFQVDILNPGRHYFLNFWMYKISTEKAVQIKIDEIGIVSANDGNSLLPGRMFGDAVECDDFQDGRKFIVGGGQRGQQLAILRNGIYRINTKLFKVKKSLITHIGKDEIGLVEAKDGKPLPSGKSFGDAVECSNFENAQSFISNGGYRGKQLRILTTGKYAINTGLFNIKKVASVKIGTAEVGLVRAKDGQPLPLGENFGRVVECNNFQDAEAFIKNGGQIGKQLAILPPGSYDINTELFDVSRVPVVRIPSGEIGLVVAQSGDSRLPGQILSKTIDCNKFQDAEAFIKNGGQKGKQRTILGSGTYRINTDLFTVITSNYAKQHGKKPEELKVYTVGSDKIGIVTTLDGKPLPHGNIAAPIIDGNNKFQDVQKFIDAGGYRGLQEEILEEGSWKLNPWFVKVEQIPLTKIKAGTVGVVISNIGRNVEQIEDNNSNESKFNIVPRGYKGIEEIPLEAGKYPLNTRVKSIEIVPTHEITLDWTNRDKEVTEYDSNLKTLELHSQDGFAFELEVTQVINIAARNAPKLISRVGSPTASTIDKIVDKIVNSDDAVKYSSIQNLVIRVLEPMVGNYFRDAAQKFNALDFLKKRDEIQEAATEHIKMALDAYGVQAVATLINEINLPEELEAPIKNITIAQVEKAQLIEERKTEEERQKLEKEKEITQSQQNLTRAEINTKIAAEEAKAQRLRDERELITLQQKYDLETTRERLLVQLGIDKLKEETQIEATKQELEKTLDLKVFQETLNMLSPELYVKMETDKMWSDAFSQFKFTAPTTLINGGSGNNNSEGLSALYSGEFQMQLLSMMTDRWSNKKSNNSQSNNSQVDILNAENLQPDLLQSDNSQTNLLNPENSLDTDTSLDEIAED